MKDYFIQNIFIKDVRDIKELEIPLDKNKRKHLIITGKNGCGKTSTLLEINNLLNKLISNGFGTIEQKQKYIKSYGNNIEDYEKQIESHNKQINIQLKQKKQLLNTSISNKQLFQIESNIKSYNVNILNAKKQISSLKNAIIDLQKQIDNFSKVDLIFSNENEVYKNIVNGTFILAYFKAKRENKQTVPQTPTKQSFQTKYDTNFELNKTFLQYMLNLKTTQAFAQIRNDNIEVEEIGKWFDNFEKSLKTIFDKDELKFVFYDKEFKFKIEYEGKSFGLNELSDGYSSLLAILTELILRMEAHKVKAYDMQGVVLIDEIETHLHVELQKKILPFLVSFFPRIQFVVTTHSPFVLSSLTDAVICDLEKRLVTEDLSGHSYESLVDTYFDTDKYSQDVKEKLKKYKEFTLKDIDNRLEKSEFKEYLKLEIFFENLPKYKNEEIGFQFNRIQQLKLGA